MAEEDSIFDELDESSSQPAVGQDYEDWWVPDEMGEHLMGVIVEIHSAPEQYTDEGEEPDPIHTILSVGRGSFDAGEAYCTKTHVQILRGLREATIGDLVNLKHLGLERTDNGNAANSYEIGVIKESTWKESEQADEIQQLIEDYPGAKGDNQRGEPYSSSSPSSAGGSAGTSEASGGTGDEGEETPADFLADLIGMQNGEMDVESADKMLNDVREFGVDVESTAEEAGLTVEDGKVKAQ